MKKLISFLGTRKFWKEFIIMTLAMFLGAAAVYYFLTPSKLIIGTVSGLSIVLSTVLEGFGINIKVSWMIFLINAILLVLAWLLIGKEFGAKTVYTALLLGPLMEVWEAIMPAQKLASIRMGSDMPINTLNSFSVMGDPWLDLVCFVLLLSISQAILFNINASTGGLDIIAKIINKYTHFDIGLSVTIGGGIICCTAFLINPFHMVIIGLIGTWINGLVIDYFMASINRKKRVSIISNQHEKLRSYIVDELRRGCSLYQVKGGYSGNEQIEIQVLLSNDEFASLMEYINEEQIDYFITAGNVSEVYGRWNKAGKVKRKDLLRESRMETGK
ncbi:MAG: YitT family protein [Candidatus Cryptobacteroides sp.]|jgi:uncharacterized membrane-anchored protein YitT (DUF2179 family)|nr:YitT family protein [Rikenellaceae bacterium]